LYAYELSGDPFEHVVQHVLTGLQRNKNAHAFAKSLVRETIERTEEIDDVIRKKVANWDFNRIAVIDRLILRMAICELLFFKDIPPKVSMNEAIELAKLFSTERSGQFINGVLDAVLNDLKAHGPGQLSDQAIPKAGRGLYEGDPDEKPVRKRGS
jgi:N utilization substance protein B